MIRTRWILTTLICLMLFGGAAAADVLNAATADVVAEPTTADSSVPIKDCKNFLDNQTETTQTHTITICANKDNTETMDIDKHGPNGQSQERPDLEAGDCDTWTVELKPGESLHVDQPGTLQIH